MMRFVSSVTDSERLFLHGWPAMRTKLIVVALVLVVASQTGCRQCGRFGSVCNAEPASPASSVPCETPGAAPPAAPPSAIEVRTPETIHVKAPPQKITVTLPPGYDTDQGCASEMCPPVWPAAPAAPQAPMMAPQFAPAAPAPMALAPVAAPAGFMGSSQTVKQRHRIA